MEGLFTLQEASDIDHRLILENSLKESELIDSAAKGALEIVRKYIENKRVLFLVGKGNNGSDALHMALLSLPLAASVMGIQYGKISFGDPYAGITQVRS